MSTTRKRHTSQFKFTISLEAAKGLKTINEIASHHNLHPNQISTWKKQLMTEGPTVFGSSGSRKQQKQNEQEAQLYEQIGRLKMELEWLKKKLPGSPDTKRSMIEVDHPALSIRRQCELIGLNRATFCRQPAGESSVNLELMRLIDREYTRAPFYGYRKMTARLNNAHGGMVHISRKTCLHSNPAT